MSKAGNNYVSKMWAERTTGILTRSSPDITTLFGYLFTVSNEEKQGLKTEAARSRVDEADSAVVQALKYGWAFGISGRKVRLEQFRSTHKCRRVRFCMARAVRKGQEIGLEQLARMERHQPTKRHHSTKPPPVRHLLG